MRSILCLLGALILVADHTFHASSAAPYFPDDGTSGVDVDEMLRRDPSFVLGMLTQLRSSILKPVENTKRGIDFGLGRGYSGNQAAKHLMGLVASQYAGGPGKRKRSQQLHPNVY